MAERMSNAAGHNLAEKLGPNTRGIPANEGGAGVADERVQQPATDKLSLTLTVEGPISDQRPAGDRAELFVFDDGFHAASGEVAGDSPGLISIQNAAKLLEGRFDRAQLDRLLAYVADLQAALKG